MSSAGRSSPRPPVTGQGSAPQLPVLQPRLPTPCTLQPGWSRSLGQCPVPPPGLQVHVQWASHREHLIPPPPCLMGGPLPKPGLFPSQLCHPPPRAACSNGKRHLEPPTPGQQELGTWGLGEGEPSWHRARVPTCSSSGRSCGPQAFLCGRRTPGLSTCWSLAPRWTWWKGRGPGGADMAVKPLQLPGLGHLLWQFCDPRLGARPRARGTDHLPPRK